MEGYCQQCIYTDRHRTKKNFSTYELEITCEKLNKKVNAYGKEKCFKANSNWQHLDEIEIDKNDNVINHIKYKD